MPIPSVTPQPRLGFMFAIEIDGLLAALVHRVQLPAMEIATVEHAAGGQGFNNKRGGGFMITDMTLEKIMLSEDVDEWAYSQLLKAYNPISQTRGLPEDYLFTVTVHHLNGAGDPVQTWEYENCWVKSVAYAPNDSTDKAAKMVESVTISVDRPVTTPTT